MEALTIPRISSGGHSRTSGCRRRWWSSPETSVPSPRSAPVCEVADGDYFAVIAADLQEPPDLLASFVEQLATGEVDVVVGERRSRDDPLFTPA